MVPTSNKRSSGSSCSSATLLAMLTMLTMLTMGLTWFNTDVILEMEELFLASPQSKPFKAVVPKSVDTVIAPTHTNTNVDWCSQVKAARKDLNHDLHIKVPCETMKPARSAVVCYITAGAADGQGNHKVFAASDYINGVLALGASLKEHLTRTDTHQLLLIREGFSLPQEAIAQLQAVGWTIGSAPDVPVDKKYLPNFERYKTLYTKTTVVGLSEYKCALLLDADALVVGNIDDLMSCNIFEDKPDKYRVGGVLDYYRGKWYHFNTGSALWNTDTAEMNRIFGLIQNPQWMRRFESDQIFSNTVYPDRTNVEQNELALVGQLPKEQWGQVVPLDWKYNAQTHVENQLPDFWTSRLSDVRIIHYTHSKGWQCPERYSPPTDRPEMPRNVHKCVKIPECACMEGYRWWNYLKKGRTIAGMDVSAMHE